MIDREKVIKGLEHCTSDCGCEECPYSKSENGHICSYNCIQDALTLLKEQEAVEPKEIVDEHFPIGDYRRTIGWLCGKCGKPIMGDADYCSYCGREVKWE